MDRCWKEEEGTEGMEEMVEDFLKRKEGRMRREEQSRRKRREKPCWCRIGRRRRRRNIASRKYYS